MKMDAAAIERWMRSNLMTFVDKCGEVDATLMVEVWDRDECYGGATLDELHPAWEIASRIAEDWRTMFDS